MRNIIRWDGSPADADGWMRNKSGAFWWRRPDADETIHVRLGHAPDYVPDDPLNIHVGRGHQAPVLSLIKWWVRHIFAAS